MVILFSEQKRHILIKLQHAEILRRKVASRVAKPPKLNLFLNGFQTPGQFIIELHLRIIQFLREVFHIFR